VLLPEHDRLKSYSLTGNGDFPRISKMEIEDKSKDDFISKAVVILQISWFVVQCIARGVQRLPITELELATVAFAGLNFVIYVLWWDKPLNVQCGVRVYKKRRTDEPVDDGHIEARAGFWVALGDALSKLPAAIVRGPSKEDMAFGLEGSPWPIRVLTWPVVKAIDIMTGGDYATVGKRVGASYPSRWEKNRMETWHLISVIAGIASAFGGIHCIGWSFSFPSTTERTLWRVASISITGVPISQFVPLFLGEFGWLDSVSDVRIERSYSALILFLYITSRLVLLILPFLSLRSLPPATYQTVDWSSLIPHI